MPATSSKMFRLKIKKKKGKQKNVVPKLNSSWCYCVTAKQWSCSGELFPHLSQHLKKAMAILPSRFIQNWFVELSALFMVTLKWNTKKAKWEIRIKARMTVENIIHQQIFKVVFKLTLILFCRIQIASQALGNLRCCLWWTWLCRDMSSVQERHELQQRVFKKQLGLYQTCAKHVGPL